MVDPEQVALAQRFSPSLELVDRRAAEVGGGDQRADARTGVEVGDDAALLERPEDTDVGKTLESTAAEHQRDASSH